MGAVVPSWAEQVKCCSHRPRLAIRRTPLWHKVCCGCSSLRRCGSVGNIGADDFLISFVNQSASLVIYSWWPVAGCSYTKLFRTWRPMLPHDCTSVAPCPRSSASLLFSLPVNRTGSAKPMFREPRLTCRIPLAPTFVSKSFIMIMSTTLTAGIPHVRQQSAIPATLPTVCHSSGL